MLNFYPEHSEEVPSVPDEAPQSPDGMPQGWSFEFSYGPSGS